MSQRKLPISPSYNPTIHGDLVSRVNLLRFIREWARAHEISRFSLVEFGVLNGESLIEMTRQLRGGIEHIVGFDTFSGIPAHKVSDLQDHANMPAFAAGSYAGSDLETVKSYILACTDFPSTNLELIEGDFRDSLNEFELETTVNFPLIFHVDVDLYSSSHVALEWIAKNAEDGSWLLLDDYWCYRGHPRMGQRKAFDEVFLKNSRIEATPYTNYKGFGRAFILNLK